LEVASGPPVAAAATYPGGERWRVREATLCRSCKDVEVREARRGDLSDDMLLRQERRSQSAWYKIKLRLLAVVVGLPGAETLNDFGFLRIRKDQQL
jgi:hypothetical protein